MPVISWAHSTYWRARANTPPPPGLSGRSGYPAWQAVIITASLFGALQDYWERLLYAFGWFLKAWRGQAEPSTEHAWLMAEWDRCAMDQRCALRHVFWAVHLPEWPVAQDAVLETSHTLGFNRHEAWIKLGHALKENAGWAENAWRRLNALKLMDARTHPTVSHPDRNLLIELAYHEYGASGRGRPVH